MPKNTSIVLGDHFNAFIEDEVESGRFGTASEVVRAGLRLLELDEKKLEALRAALVDGESSGIASPKPFARVRHQLGLKSRRG